MLRVQFLHFSPSSTSQAATAGKKKKLWNCPDQKLPRKEDRQRFGQEVSINLHRELDEKRLKKATHTSQPVQAGGVHRASLALGSASAASEDGSLEELWGGHLYAWAWALGGVEAPPAAQPVLPMVQLLMVHLHHFHEKSAENH